MIEENNNTLPLVTIGVLSYNNARFIIETLDSIKAQTYSNIELIIVDDCSQDNSVELISNWLDENRYSAEFIVNEKNLGIPKNCNKILYRAKGKYLCLFGSDDVMLPERIKIQVEQFEKIEEKDTALVYGDGLIINENNEILYNSFWELAGIEKPIKSTYISFNQILKTNIIFAPSSFYKKEKLVILGGYDERFSFEDLDLNLRLSRILKIKYFPELLVKYRKHSKGLANSIGTNSKDFFLIFKKHLNSNNPIAKNHYLNFSRKLLIEDKDFLIKNFSSFGYLSFFVKTFLLLRFPNRVIDLLLRKI